MPGTRPSLTLLRELTDTHVLEALIVHSQLTRAELAELTEISKPTISESVRRLVAAGVLVDTGARTSGRGGVGTYFALADDVGVALAVSVAPDGIVGELVDVRGEVTARATAHVRRPARPGPVGTSLRRVARRLRGSTTAPIRVAVISAADPVDRRSGRLVQLPDLPFLLGALAPADAVADVVTGRVVVDNDVNWAARAERHRAPAGSMDDFIYLYLGEGLGCAVTSDGEVRRGHSGIAGEIAYVLTSGVDGQASRFIDVFADLGLRHPESTAIDVDRLTAVADAAASSLDVVGDAVCGVLTAAIAMTDPAVIVLGGPWGTHPRVVQAVRARAHRLPRRVAIQPAVIADGAPLAGARLHAVQALRATVVGNPAWA